MGMGNKHSPQIHQPLLSPDALIERLHGSYQWQNKNAQSYCAPDICASFTSDCIRLRRTRCSWLTSDIPPTHVSRCHI